ncbi:hypothetical protein CONCODRAFT_10191 [Conidiobolus coronatus NRRL 28638]|uniref:Uncharacterized protein n=1 Tax=Conidiobolus coronatus (strain ATCC 28846 / CBS 209.66 / NRRL 28638) TaxID=796925 RepID=A0A137NYH1_CONC2|nr:hypothetical protein CONCODRAFT_10191 [Conidiobolus coronatus NRRL 28638]|eukprot:KXN67704.1 hypothetical protein CONCODRAFT_10191 [Conidiobolus coronatus NRRL 28638]
MEVADFELIQDPFKTRDKIPRSPIQVNKRVSFNKGLSSKSRPPSILISRNKVGASPPSNSTQPSKRLSVYRTYTQESVPLCRIPSVFVQNGKKQSKTKSKTIPPIRVPSPFRTRDKIPRDRPSVPELSFPSANIVQLTDSMENPESDYSSSDSEKTRSVETIHSPEFNTHVPMLNSIKSTMNGLPLEPPSPFLLTSHDNNNYHSNEALNKYQFMPRKNRFNSYQSQDSVDLPLRPPSPFGSGEHMDSPLTEEPLSPMSRQPELSLPSKHEINRKGLTTVQTQPALLKSPSSLTSFTERDPKRFSRPSLPTINTNHIVDQDELISIDQVKKPRTLSIQFKKEMISFANFENIQSSPSASAEKQTETHIARIKKNDKRLTPLEPILIRTTPRSSPRPTPPKTSLEQEEEDGIADLSFSPVTTVPSRIMMNPAHAPSKNGSTTKLTRSRSQKVVNGEKFSIEQARITDYNLEQAQLEEQIQKRSMCGTGCTIM